MMFLDDVFHEFLGLPNMLLWLRKSQGKKLWPNTRPWMVIHHDPSPSDGSSNLGLRFLSVFLERHLALGDLRWPSNGMRSIFCIAKHFWGNVHPRTDPIIGEVISTASSFLAEIHWGSGRWEENQRLIKARKILPWFSEKKTLTVTCQIPNIIKYPQ